MNQDIPRDLSSMPSRPKSRKNLIIMVAVIVVIAIVATLLVANSVVQSQPTANISATNWTMDQGITGPTTFNVTVTNSGGAIGSATIQCVVYIPAADGGNQTNYNTTQVISLGSGVTQTCSIVVNTPFGTTVTTDMCAVNVNPA